MAVRSVVGALVGWKRAPSEHGFIFTFQVMTPEAAAQGGDPQHVTFALNDRQLRSLARDLQRSAMERGIPLWPQPKWWKLLLRRLGR